MMNWHLIKNGAHDNCHCMGSGAKYFCLSKLMLFEYGIKTTIPGN